MPLDVDDMSLFRKTLRHVIDTNPPHRIPDELYEQGWQELAEADPAGAITALGEEAGAARSPAPVADLAVLWGAGQTADSGTAVVYDDIAFAGVERAASLIRITDAKLTRHAAEGVRFEPAGGFDPKLGLQRVIFPASAAASRGVDGASSHAPAIAAGRRALASQMVGAATEMLEDTLAYVGERRQYGRAIGSFQTVKHRLADVKVAVTAARAGIETAWTQAEGDEAPLLAVAAKCLAARAQRLASTHCFQVHGGIAFAVEHGFQQWVRRGLLLDLLLGDESQLTKRLGRELIAQRQIPRTPDLY